jgi:hypothetical protein
MLMVMRNELGNMMRTARTIISKGVAYCKGIALIKQQVTNLE